MKPPMQDSGPSQETAGMRLDPRKRKLIKKLTARNRDGAQIKLDLDEPWYLDNSASPWTIAADIKLPVRFGFTLVPVELEISPLPTSQSVISVALYPPRIFLLD